MNKIHTCITALLLSASLSTAQADGVKGKFTYIEWEGGGSSFALDPSVLKLTMPDGTTCYALTTHSLVGLLKSLAQFQGLGCIK